MQHPDEGTVHAWLDGELSAEEVQALESHIATCPECSAKVAEERGFVAASSRIVGALDIVPGDVIPAATTSVKTRPWYSTTQFRAAAGILVVAGASFLLLNKGQPREAQRAMELSKPQPVESPMPMLSAGAADSASLPVTPEAKPNETKQRLVAKEARKTEVAQQSKPVDAVADMTRGGIAAAAPAALNTAAPAPAPPQAKRIAADSNVLLSDVVVTGVATVAESPLKLLSSDTSQAAVKDVYEVGKGVEVTLVESTLRPRTFTRNSAQAERTAQPMAAAPPPAAANEAQAATNSITWSKGNKVFTLTGMMSRIQLEAIRLRLPEDKR